MTEIELAGETWEVESKPSFGSVRELRRREKLLQMKFLDLSETDPAATMEEVIQKEVLSDAEKATEFMVAQEDFQLQAALCLGTGAWFSTDMLEDCGEEEVWSAVDTVLNELGVDSVNHFFERYRAGQFSRTSEAAATGVAE